MSWKLRMMIGPPIKEDPDSPDQPQVAENPNEGRNSLEYEPAFDRFPHLPIRKNEVFLIIKTPYSPVSGRPGRAGRTGGVSGNGRGYRGLAEGIADADRVRASGFHPFLPITLAVYPLLPAGAPRVDSPDLRLARRQGADSLRKPE